MKKKINIGISLIFSNKSLSLLVIRNEFVLNMKKVISSAKYMGIMWKARNTVRWVFIIVIAVGSSWAVEVYGSSSDEPKQITPHIFGGPTSVGTQLEGDGSALRNAADPLNVKDRLKSYYELKEKPKQDYGLSLGGDYNFLYQYATKTVGSQKNAAAGAARIYGHWTLVNRGQDDPGAIVFKYENRHRFGAPIPPSQLSGQIGYAGLTTTTFSNANNILTNLYWSQIFDNNRFGIIAGIVDVTDYVDVYALVDPWEDFSNYAFTTNPTIPAPDQGLGAAARLRLTDHYYILAGLCDANGDPGDPADSFDSFFNTHEFFKHIEVGWISSWQNRYTDNIHVTVWQVDELDQARVDDGWGVAASVSKKFEDRWLPFLRAGYSEDSGALLKNSVSAGLGYLFEESDDAIGIGVGWGRANESLYGDGSGRDQYTTELYCRKQVMPHITIRPSVQWLIDPALYPEEGHVFVLGFGARIVF